ncbi:MAG TPA: DUF4410 domain-containing protein [Terriglobales bacterium]|nr:DUF4410 domain-containing protein [Terriglobales bacterium]
MKSHFARNISGHRHLSQATWTRQLSLVIFAAFLLVPFCMGQGGDANNQKPTLSQVDKNKVIYVRDFELDPNNFTQDKGGITGKGYLIPPPPGSFLRRKRQDPTIAAHKLIRLMSESLVADLQKAGFTARRLSVFEDSPAEGLIMTGVFTELNEGNQMRRALLGFGSGKAKMQLYVMLADASQGEQRLYETSTQKNSGKMPGSEIAINPYVGAAGFVARFGMTKNAPEKMVKKTASKITAQVAEKLNAGSSPNVEACSRH